MTHARRDSLLVLLVVATLAFVGGLVFARRGAGPEAPPIEGLLWPNPPLLEPFTLLDGDGQPLTEQALAGHWTLLFFGFTHCPDVCPGTLTVLKEVTGRLRERPDFATHGQVMFVSVDPARDTPRKLADYLHHFDPAFIGASAPSPQLTPFLRQLGILHTRVDLDGNEGGDYTMDHTASVLLIGPDLSRLAIFAPPHRADELVDRIARIMAFVGATS